MLEYLHDFYAAKDIEAKWLVCQQHADEQWTIGRRGFAVGEESAGGRFMVTTIPLDGFNGNISYATVDLPRIEAGRVTQLRVYPPRSFDDLKDCNCPLICYDE